MSVETRPAAAAFSGRVRNARELFRHRSLAAGTVIVAAVVLLALAAPFLPLPDPVAQDFSQAMLPPGPGHPLGTDNFGRDVLSRTLHGGLITMGASLAIVVLGALIGTVIGLIAGYVGGVVGFAIMRLVDLMLAFPGILLALAVAAIMGPGLRNGVLAVALVLVPAFVRVVEGATVQVRQLPFVEAAKLLGVSTPRTVVRHILPNVRASIIVLTTSWLGIAALWIAALGFLGLGVQPPAAEWGAMLNEGQQFTTIAWWMSVFPGLLLSIFVVGISLVGDGLRDQLDPRVSTN